MKTIRPMLILLLTLLCVFGAARAESTATDLEPPAISVTEGGLTLGAHCLRWPQLSGMENEEIQTQLNARLLTHAHAAELSARVAALLGEEQGLESEYTLRLDGQVLCYVTRITGPVASLRRQTLYDSLVADLTDGRVLSLTDVVTDTEALADWIDELSGALSAQLIYGSLLPLPEVFTVSDSGLTLYYPSEQYTQLNGEPGTVFLTWLELESLLPLDENALWRRVGGTDMCDWQEKSLKRLTAAVEAGALPGVPAALGEELDALATRYGLETDPDFYRDGRYIQLSDGAFRQVLLMTDRLREKAIDGSVVRGIRLERGSVYGLRIGQTTVDTWRSYLGEPDGTVDLDAEAAEAWRLEAGTSDYYRLGGHVLRLHADSEGVLKAIMLTE